MRRIFNKRLLILGWALVIFFTLQLILVINAPDRPVSRTVTIEPLAVTDTAVQRQSLD